MYVPFLFRLQQRRNAEMFGGPCQGINTTMTLVQICQTAQFNFSFLDFTYLDLVQLGAATIGMVTFWYMQRYWKIESKKMARLLAVISLKPGS
jgi:Vacuole effluxer Atg22 like